MSLSIIHDANFKNLEHKYRVQYIANARVTGQCASWIPIEFPKSTRSGLIIGHSRNNKDNKSTLRFYTQYLLLFACGIMAARAIFKNSEKYT